MTVKYSKDHEWVTVENGIATIGITNHAQEQLGDVVFIELPAIGKNIAAHDQAAVVESVKAASTKADKIAALRPLRDVLTIDQRKEWVRHCLIMIPQ